MPYTHTSNSETHIKVAYVLLYSGAALAIAAFFVELWWFLVVSVILADCSIVISYLAATNKRRVQGLETQLIIFAIVAHTPVAGVLSCPLFIYIVRGEGDEKVGRLLIPAGLGLMLVAALQILGLVYKIFLGGGLPGYLR